MDVFVIAPYEVFQDHRLTLMQLRVLLAIFSFRKKDTGIAYPKRKSLAERCGYSEAVISRTTTQLVNLGWLEKTGKGGFSSPCKYKIIVPTVTDSVTVTEPVTVTDSVTKTVTDSVTGKEHINEHIKTITTTREGSILNDVQREIFVWASTHEYWHKATSSEEEFLKALCSPKGGMRRQFENRFKQQTGGSNATHKQSTRPAKVSAADRVEQALAERYGNAAENVIELDKQQYRTA